MKAVSVVLSVVSILAICLTIYLTFLGVGWIFTTYQIIADLFFGTLFAILFFFVGWYLFLNVGGFELAKWYERKLFGEKAQEPVNEPDGAGLEESTPAL